MPSCPGPETCRSHFPQLDHARLWVPASHDYGQPFLLSHPYSDEVAAETRAYAEAHGLALSSETYLGDDWYGHGTLPIRLTIPENWPLWPIEREALVLLSTQPVRWPDNDDSD